MLFHHVNLLKNTLLLSVKHQLMCLFIVMHLLVSSFALADNRVKAKWYRYYENGIPQMSQTVTNKHLQLGYEELDSSFRVIKKVTPYSKEEADAKEKAKQVEQEKVNKVAEANDKLIKTYSTSKLAVRKRKELLGDIQSKRGFALQQLHTANTELSSELKQASNIEKSGKPVPDSLKQSIESKRSAVKNAQNSINDLMINQMARVHQMTQDIRRLRKIESGAQN